MENKSAVFIGVPTHDFKVDVRMATAVFQQASQRNYPIVVAPGNSSLLALNCNNLWCQALNKRLEYGLKWFAMVHSDVIPEPFWLDKLIDIAEQNDADLLSCVIPIKSPDGITSTALSKDYGKAISMRLTQTQIHEGGLPDTFSIDDFENVPLDKFPGLTKLREGFDNRTVKLLVNTGCMICRIDQHWSDELYFTINDGITRQFNKYVSSVEPEDWFFSRMVAEKGGKVMATKAVKVSHIGQNAYQSDLVWGRATDPAADV